MNEREEVCKNYFFRVKTKLFRPADNADKEFFAMCLRETPDSLLESYKEINRKMVHYKPFYLDKIFSKNNTAIAN